MAFIRNVRKKFGKTSKLRYTACLGVQRAAFKQQSFLNGETEIDYFQLKRTMGRHSATISQVGN